MRKLLYGIMALMIFAGVAVALESTPCPFVKLDPAKEQAVQKALDKHDNQMSAVRDRYYQTNEMIEEAQKKGDSGLVDKEQQELMKIRGEIMMLWGGLAKEIEKITGVKDPLKECPGLLGRTGCRSGKAGGCPFAVE